VPQAQAAQQRLTHASAPPSYRQASNSSKVHRREGYLASMLMKLVIFILFFYSSAECSYPVAAENGLGTGLGNSLFYLILPICKESKKAYCAFMPICRVFFSCCGSVA
jgi:hypothetical protein